MTRSKIILGIIVLIIPVLLLFTMKNGSDMVKAFEPGLISTDKVEYSPTFSSSCDEMYFARSSQQWASGAMTSSIYHSRKEHDQWTMPELVSFSGQFDDSDPHLSRNGKTLYFISGRPSGELPNSHDIWLVQKESSGEWGEPLRMPAPINSQSTEYSPRTNTNGNLYFASDRPGGYGQGDLYMARLVDGTFKPPVNLGSQINSEKGEWNLEINGPGDLLILKLHNGRKIYLHTGIFISVLKRRANGRPLKI